MWTKNKYGNYCSPNAINPTKALFISNSTNVVDKKGLSFKKVGTSITKPSVTNVTIKFDGNGGTASATKLSNIKVGDIMGSKIPTATRYGYIFDGWYTAKNGGTKYTNSTKITSSDNNRTLYAHWISKLDNGCTGNLKAGHLYRIVNKKSGYALQPDSDSNGALVKQRAIANTNRQIWKVGFSGGCVFYNGFGGKCLDIKSKSIDNGAALQLYGTDDESQDNRIFSLVSRGSGYYSIHPNHSGRAIDIQNASTSAGAQVQQYYYTGNSQQLFSFQEVTNRDVEFFDNLSNNYLPSPREVYNHSGGSNPKDCYISRKTDYVTTSVNATQNKLIITAKKAGSSGNDMTFKTTVNGSYNFDLYDSNTNTMYLCFTAKSSVPGAKMYFRWGYDSAYKSVTLNTTSTNYIISLPRTLNSGDCIHPYVDRACTIEMTNIQLKSNSSASVDLSRGDTFNYQTKIYNVNYNNGTYGSLPQPTTVKSGYIFDGWYTDRIGGTRVTESSKLNYNTRLYAHWVKSPETSHTHSYDSGKVTKKATCKTTGVKIYTCISCEETKIETIAKTGHVYENAITKATLSKNGKIVNKCIDCGNVSKTTTVYYPKTIKLSKYSFTYNGKVQKPNAIVKDSKGNTLKLNKDYTVTYSNANSKTLGKYTVTIKFKGNYTGTKTIGYHINPKGTEFVPSNKGGFKAIKNGFTLKWNKQASQTTGYQIQYATKSDFSNAASVTITNTNTTSYTFKNRAGGTRYYVRIRTYKKANGKTYFSAWNSGTKSVVTLK
ncbi:MAG: InlB B-repeat-containing protein [Eubacterium sp.]|nr:InlB B-repeat-containing protein [Eubacterium sp.]